MSLRPSEPTREPQHPLDVLEDIVAANEWRFERSLDDDMVVEIPGRWCEYRLFFQWRQDLGSLYFSCAFDVRVPEAKRREINDLLALVNEAMWLGHFAVCADERVPMFRHTVPMRGLRGASVEQLEDLVDAAVIECDRFFPAFHWVLWGDKSAADAVQAAMPNTVGEA